MSDDKPGYKMFAISRAMTAGVMDLISLTGLEIPEILGCIFDYGHSIGKTRENCLALCTEIINQIFDQREKIQHEGCQDPLCPDCRKKADRGGVN